MSESKPFRIVTDLPKLRPRKPESNKGDYGRVLVVAGSRGMSGAAVLTGSAALRAGAGLVRVAGPAEIQPIVAAGNPCYTTAALPQDDQGRLDAAAIEPIRELADSSHVLAIGPGLGRSPGVSNLLHDLLDVDVPLVLDADALNAIVGDTAGLNQRQQATVLTPHPGEFARLTGETVSDIQANRVDRAVAFARARRVILVLKGSETLVTDGDRLYRNTTGNPGLATGGTGDVLTGVIAALLGQGLESFAAAALGAHVHGLAGDLARDQRGEVSLIASDLLEHLPRAFLRLSSMG